MVVSQAGTNASTKLTSVRSTSPVLVTSMTNVASSPSGTDCTSGDLVTAKPGAIASTSAISLSAHGFPSGSLAVTLTVFVKSAPTVTVHV